MLTAAQVRELLNMLPHPVEGGFYAETYRTPQRLQRVALPAIYPGDRSLATAIYYMLTPETISEMHRVRGDEMFHFYLGDPVEMLELRPNGGGEIVVLGQDIASGMKLQHVVSGGVWQGSRLRPGGAFALLGTTMSPGFEYEDYETGNRDELIAKFPSYGELIRARTR
jgi:predicted cupin superfamily sugar epimerase